jgi:transposase
MVTPNDLDIKEGLIQDIIKKKRKTSDVATILRVSIRTIQRRICRYKYNGTPVLMRSKP